MEYTRLGSSGLKVSRLCLGTMTYGSPKWREYVLEEEASRPFFRRALELGINFFDTADMYSLGVSEEIVGRALRDFARREEVVIATKVFNPMGGGVNDRGLSRKHVLAAVDASLKRLCTDYIDLYQIHRLDPETPLEETLQVLDDLVRAGKVRYVGACNMWSWTFAKALFTAAARGWTRFVSMQIHHNLIYREEERELIPLCLDQGIGFLPWSPLARGLLAGSRRREGGGESARSQTDEVAQRMYFKQGDFDVVDRVVALSRERGVEPAQIALAWLLNKPGITAPIVGASKMHHLEQAVQAVGIRLTAEEMARLEEPYQPHPMLGFR